MGPCILRPSQGFVLSPIYTICTSLLALLHWVTCMLYDVQIYLYTALFLTPQLPYMCVNSQVFCTLNINKGPAALERFPLALTCSTICAHIKAEQECCSVVTLKGCYITLDNERMKKLQYNAANY